MLDVVQILQELVAIPSVNPMGLTVWRDEHGEARLTDYLERFFRRLGVPHIRQAAEPGRDNILAKIEGHAPPGQPVQVLLFSVHQDTVPVDGMIIPPWTPTVRDGRLYGRGACDVKGGMAAMLVALTRLVENPPQHMPTLLLACTVNEECALTGVQALARLCRDGAADFVPRLPDAAIVAEPTSLQVVVAHKGIVRWNCHTLGLAAHSATPERGQNAIYAMARVVRSIDRYHTEVLGARDIHPRCGRATVSVGVIHGGVSVNTVPDRATIQIDRRLLPSETADEAQRDLIEFVQRQTDLGDRVVHDPPFLHGRPLSDRENGPLAERLVRIARETAVDCRCVGVAYATDGSTLAEAGIPTVIFGPGSIAQAHTADEWIALDQLTTAVNIYDRFVRVGLHDEIRTNRES